MDVQMDQSYRKLGELLIEKELLTERQVHDALAMQKQSPARLGEIATAMGWASEKQISECLAVQYGYELIDPAKIECSSEALGTMSYPRSLKNLTLPVKFESSQLHCVIADPINIVALDELRSAQRFPLEVTLAAPSDLREAIIRCYVGETPVPDQGKAKVKIKADDQSDRVALLRALSHEYESDAQFGRRGW